MIIIRMIMLSTHGSGYCTIPFCLGTTDPACQFCSTGFTIRSLLQVFFECLCHFLLSLPFLYVCMCIYIYRVFVYFST